MSLTSPDAGETFSHGARLVAVNGIGARPRLNTTTSRVGAATGSSSGRRGARRRAGQAVGSPSIATPVTPFSGASTVANAGRILRGGDCQWV